MKITPFFTISRSILFTIKNASDKSCRENQNTNFMFNNPFFENPIVYEIIWKNNLESGRPRITIWRMRIACWIPKATNTHSECVISIAFTLQYSLHERASILLYTHIACIVSKWFFPIFSILIGLPHQLFLKFSIFLWCQNFLWSNRPYNGVL
jgi:hypothetical protein